MWRFNYKWQKKSIIRNIDNKLTTYKIDLRKSKNRVPGFRCMLWPILEKCWNYW